MSKIKCYASLLAGSLALGGCVTGTQTPLVNNPQPFDRTGPGADTPARGSSSKPGPAATVRASAFEGTIRAIDHKSREVTFQLPDGKRATVHIAAKAGNLSDLQVGDHAAFELAETVELIKSNLHPETGTIVEEHAAGSAKERESYNPYYNQDTHASSKLHHVAWTEVIDVPARVVSVSAEKRVITLKTYEGRTFTVRTGTDVTSLGDFEPGEAIVARFREVDDITEIAPQ
ncbi:MAG: hypothetical protein PHT19_03170 [Methylococcus sp.]|nr:hypothetical protein [Methylococcus sp.]